MWVSRRQMHRLLQKTLNITNRPLSNGVTNGMILICDKDGSISLFVLIHGYKSRHHLLEYGACRYQPPTTPASLAALLPGM